MEVDGLQDVLGCVELQEQHDEDPMVGQLLELRLPDVVVLNQHPDDDAQHLEEPADVSGTRAQRPTGQGGRGCTLLRRLILVTVLVASPECLTSRAISLTKASRLW